MRALIFTQPAKARRGLVIRSLLASCLLAASTMSSITSAQDLLPYDNGLEVYHKPPRWRESESHPLRILAYVFHPIGWGLREAIFRPFSYFAGSNEVNKSVWGFREPFDWRDGICDKGGDNVPDCRKIAPWNSIGYGPGGVENSEMASAPEQETAMTARQVCIPDVAFDFNKSNLNPLGKGRVRQVAQLLTSEPSIEVVVEGNTDYVGADDYNQKLGERRAESVIKELVELGVDPKRLAPVSRGESAPVFTEEEDWARAVNRRVRFEIKSDMEAAPEVKG